MAGSEATVGSEAGAVVPHLLSKPLFCDLGGCEKRLRFIHGVFEFEGWERVCDDASVRLKGAGRKTSARSALPRFHIFPQYRVDRGLVALAVVSKKLQHIWVKAKGDLLLMSGPANGLLKEICIQLWDVRIVDVLIPHRIDPLPISS